MNDGQEFTTKRLLVRLWRKDDQPKVLALYSDPEVIRWIDDGTALTPANARKWMQVTKENYEKRGYGMFAIDARNTGETIGFGGIVHPGGQSEPEIKYAFRQDVWGQGIATEFVRGLVHYGLTVHKLRHITATAASENHASCRVLLKSGLQRHLSRTEEDGSQTYVFVLGG